MCFSLLLALLEFLIWSSYHPLRFEQVANWTFLGIGYTFLLLAFTLLVIAVFASLLGPPEQKYNQTPSEVTDKSLDILRAEMEMSVSGPISFKESSLSVGDQEPEYISNNNTPDPPPEAPIDMGGNGSSKGRLSRKSTKQSLHC